MTTRTAQDPDNHDLEHSAMPARRAIPDGGLGAAMPDWLQETPGWKRPPQTAAARPIPDPDTSVIDPARLIDVDDLPEWLRAVSTREPADHVPATAPPIPEAPGSPMASDLAAIVPVEQGALERAKASPGSSREAADDGDPIHLITASGDAGQPWWLSDGAVAVLFVAIILTMIYVVLVATGVV